MTPFADFAQAAIARKYLARARLWNLPLVKGAFFPERGSGDHNGFRNLDNALLRTAQQGHRDQVPSVPEC